MKKLHKIIKNHWEKQGVKFKVSKEKLVWIKTLRSVDCAICKKHLVEKKEDEGFDNWCIMPEIINPQGKAPEICPDCAKKFNLPFKPARRVQCKKCGISQKEKMFGVGFPGWLIAPGEQNKGLLKGFCPNCYVNFIAPSMPQFISSTWYDLTFTSGSLLTSTKMTQLDGNFDALAAQESGAPTIDHGTIQGLGDDDHTQYLTTGRHDTTARHPKTVIATATGSTNGTLDGGADVDLSLNDYCFFPNIYGTTHYFDVRGYPSWYDTTVARFSLRNDYTAAKEYTIKWRYMTASNNPQIWIVQDPVTGEIIGIWQADDPPEIDATDNPFKIVPIQYRDREGKPYGITNYIEIPSFLDEFKETLNVGIEEIRKRYKLRRKSTRPKNLPMGVRFCVLEKI